MSDRHSTMRSVVSLLLLVAALVALGLGDRQGACIMLAALVAYRHVS